MMAGTLPQRRIRLSGWALRVAVFSIALIGAAGVLHRLFGLSTLVALNLFLLAFIGAVISVLLGGIALWRIWQSGYRGTGTALVAIVIAVAILMWPLSVLPTAQALPNINDVTTDVNQPPAFQEIVKRRPLGSNPTTYPGGDFAKLQQAAYPDLRTLRLERDAAETVTLVAQALVKLRMEVVREDAPDRRGGNVGYVEAIDRTLILGFYDDVVVRVAGSGQGARVDVRSASRFGQHDLGRNAERVRQILAAIVERVQATVPKDGRRPRR